MSETVQDIRGKVQELLNRAQVDADFRQKLQMNPADVLCTAGVPNVVAVEPGEYCPSMSCLITCWWSDY